MTGVACHPSPCLICRKYTELNEDGSLLQPMYAYQRIDGKLRLATEIVLHTPLYFIHEDCQ